jgi:hypothetical protein
MKHSARLLLAAATLVAASSAHAASISLANGDFQGGFSTGDNPAGWAMTEYVNGVYVATAPVYGEVLHFKEARGSDTTLFVTQDLSANNIGLTAADYGAYSLTLDLGWRTNTTGADAILRFSLVNLSEGNAVLGFTDFTLLKGATVNNSYTLRNDNLALNIAYDNTAGNLVGDNIGLKISRIDVDDSTTDNDTVVWMDNLSMTAVPEPSTYGLIGAGALAAVAFVRRRRKNVVQA